jgi:hypothetical protein
MAEFIDVKKELDFNEWLNSIEFVDEEGKVSETKLTDDESDDPEGDRE